MNARREDAAGSYISTLSDSQIQILAGVLNIIEPEDENPPVEALRERLISEVETGSIALSDIKALIARQESHVRL